MQQMEERASLLVPINTVYFYMSFWWVSLAIFQMINTSMIADTSAITIVDINEPKAPAQQQHHQKDEPYSVFSTRTKILIVLTVSISGFFSPFSTNIYFPALSMIEKASDTVHAYSQVELCCCTYMLIVLYI